MRRRIAAAVLAALVLPKLATAGGEPEARAVNVGGPAFVGAAGTAYLGDAFVSGGRVGRLEADSGGGVRGADDVALYETWREGDVTVALPLPDGRWNLTLHLLEPHDREPGERIFDVQVEGAVRLAELDPRAYRTWPRRGAVSVTIPDVVVTDGQLDVTFLPRVGEPILGGFEVSAPADRGPGWELVWHDEFDVDGAPDPERWTLESWEAGRVNGEEQAYTPRPRNARVVDGRLVIEAHREDHAGARYTSGRLHSRGKGDFLYGRFEFRARLPRGQGTWAALWMLPSDPYRYATICAEGDEIHGNPDCDAWPNSGEIDILEHVGYQMNHVHGTVHTRAYFFMNDEQRGSRVVLDDVAGNFHVYGLEWSPDEIVMFADDVPYFRYRRGTGDWRVWPFDHAFHLIMNLAVGGSWGAAGGPVDESIFPQRMEIDWVRVYRRTDPAGD